MPKSKPILRNQGSSGRTGAALESRKIAVAEDPRSDQPCDRQTLELCIAGFLLDFHLPSILTCKYHFAWMHDYCGMDRKSGKGEQALVSGVLTGNSQRELVVLPSQTISAISMGVS